jgi:hypothetical protein
LPDQACAFVLKRPVKAELKEIQRAVRADKRVRQEGRKIFAKFDGCLY